MRSISRKRHQEMLRKSNKRNRKSASLALVWLSFGTYRTFILTLSTVLICCPINWPSPWLYLYAHVCVSSTFHSYLLNCHLIDFFANYPLRMKCISILFLLLMLFIFQFLPLQSRIISIAFLTPTNAFNMTAVSPTTFTFSIFIFFKSVFATVTS